jgi:hypothetical protein
MKTASTAQRREIHDPPRYGDYPELFWDLRPDEPIDVEHPAVLGRILASGSFEMIRAMVPFDTIRRNLDEIEAPEHVRGFWKLVVQQRDAGQEGPGRSDA